MFCGLKGRNTPPEVRMRDRARQDDSGKSFIRANTCEEAGHLHERVILGESVACDSIAERLLPVLCHRLGRTFKRADGAVIESSVEDAILEYLRAPAKFDPARGPTLESFLFHAARRNVINELQSIRRRASHEVSLDPQAIESIGIRPMSVTFQSEFDTSDIREVLGAATTSGERAAVRLWLSGERRTTALAAILCSGLPVCEQRAEVKRFKDRIVKRVRRHHVKERQNSHG